MSRELYDLCRRYKHFYKKHQDVMEWSRKYHDLDLGSAIDTVSFQLNDAKHELQKGLFKEFDVCCRSIDTENEVPMGGRMDGMYIPLALCHSKSDVEFHNSNEFLHCLMVYMHEMNKYEMR